MQEVAVTERVADGFVKRGRGAHFDVTVGTPCSEQWEAMAGDARARHCSHCKKTVHNLSGMTAAAVELLAMRSAAGDEVCGRVTRDALGELVMLPGAMSARASAAPRVLMSMALAAGVPAAAQAVKPDLAATALPLAGDGFAYVADARAEVAPGIAVLTGRLVRPDGSHVDTGLVALDGEGAGAGLYVVDDRGRFELRVAPGTYQLAMQTGPEQGEDVRTVTLHEGFQSVGTVKMRAGQRDVAEGVYTTMGTTVMTISGWSWKARLRHPVLYVRSVVRRLR